MKKEYRKPVVACTDMEKGEMFSNSPEYEKKISCQGWKKRAEEQGVIRFADELSGFVYRKQDKEIGSEEKFYANPEFVYREVAGESILVPSGKMALKFNGLASLNRTGVFLWKLLEQERTFPELIRAFAEEYDLTEEQSAEDVAGFLKLALTRELVLRS